MALPVEYVTGERKVGRPYGGSSESHASRLRDPTPLHPASPSPGPVLRSSAADWCRRVVISRGVF